jgi:polar amino acid transport system permease protein
VTFDWPYAWSILPVLIEGAKTTLLATVSGMLVACSLGLLIVLGRLSPFRLVRWAAGVYVDILRATPLLVLLYFLFFALPNWGIVLGGFECGVIGLGLCYSAYIAEVYRAGIEDIPRGQWEAATALDLGAYRTWVGVIIPQAIPRIVPVLGNNLIGMFKDTTVLSTITVIELMGAATTQASITFRYLEPYTMVGFIFLALSYPSSILVRTLDRRVRR